MFARQSTLGALLLLACSETTDPLGDVPVRFGPFTGPAEYPNAFLAIDQTESKIATKLDETFEALFHGNSTQVIYFEREDGTARIEDIYHSDVRTEGMGLGMMITVQLDKQTEFDKLWRYAKTALLYEDPPKQGYFRSWCSRVEAIDRKRECADPYGHQQMLMALLFASKRWGRTSGDIDYEKDAFALLHVMRNQETKNGGIQDGVTNMFDEDTKLVFDVPEESAAGVTRPSVEMPAFYELFAQATGDSFYAEAAAAAREHWQRSTNKDTGLMPIRSSFEGAPVPQGSSTGSAGYHPEAYRAQLNMAIDRIWFGRDANEEETCDKLLAFFRSVGTAPNYGRSYRLDGTAIDTAWEPALTPVNGATALCGTIEDNLDFVEDAWNATFTGNKPYPNGSARYYHGVMHLTALLILSGNYRVY